MTWSIMHFNISKNNFLNNFCMKKIFLLLVLSFILSACSYTSNDDSTYTSNDLSNAQYLAENALIKSQTSPTLYRLDDFILRHEVIDLAVKMRWIPLPENYTCKKYFSDVTTDERVCRTIELAADNGIISREQSQVLPMGTVTRAEALAILLKTEKISLSEPRRVVQDDGSTWSLYEDLKSFWFTQWQADMMDSLPNCLTINHGVSCEDGADLNMAIARFQPNTTALRSEVFEYAALMMWFRAEEDTDVQ